MNDFHTNLNIRSIYRQDLTPIDLKNFYVVTCISNTQRYKSRYHLYRQFAKHMQDSNVNLFTIELAYGNRPFEITEKNYGTEIQVRTRQELWHKENLLNLAIQNLPKDWEYVAWIDADVTFMRPDWAHETVQKLQHYDFVQMFSDALDIGPHPGYQVVNHNLGFMYCYHNQLINKTIPPLLIKDKLNPRRMSPIAKNAYTTYGGKVYYHSGFAWAARRTALIKCGGLLDASALGAADHHMCLGMLGLAKESLPTGVSKGYEDHVIRWQKNCLNHVRKNVGYVPGTIHHAWHGSKVNRKYHDRWKILVENNFDPYNDLIKDPQGLYQLVDHGDERSVKLRDQIRSYFNQRDEDSNSL